MNTQPLHQPDGAKGSPHARSADLVGSLLPAAAAWTLKCEPSGDLSRSAFRQPPRNQPQAEPDLQEMVSGVGTPVRRWGQVKRSDKA